MVSTVRWEISSYPPPWHTACHHKKQNTFTWAALGWATCSPKGALRNLETKALTSLTTCRESSKAKYQTVQLRTCGIVSHNSHSLFFVFKFQAFSIYLKIKSAQYTSRSIKWKSQTKSSEAFWGLFWFRSMNNMINGCICCIFNSLYK